MNATTLAVLRAIRQLTAERHGQPPSLREIAKTVTVSLSAVDRHIQQLVKLGLVEHKPRIARGIVLTASGKREAAK